MTILQLDRPVAMQANLRRIRIVLQHVLIVSICCAAFTKLLVRYAIQLHVAHMSLLVVLHLPNPI